MSDSYDNNCNKSDNINNNNNTYSEWYLRWGWEIIISITGYDNENDNERSSNNDDDNSDDI